MTGKRGRGRPALPRAPVLTVDGFDALVERLAMQDHTREAARLVLVLGEPPSAAARTAGMSTIGVLKVLARCKRRMAQAQRVSDGVKNLESAL